MKQVERKPAAVRKREIAEAAMCICGTRGASSLTTATIAEAVGVSTGALFRHFRTLEDVLHEAAVVAIEKMEKPFPPSQSPPADRLLELARARVELLGGDAGLAWMLSSEEARLKLPKDAVAELAKLVTKSKQFIMKALKQGQQDGSIRDDIAPDALIVCVLGTIHALIGMGGIRGNKKRTTRNVKTETVLQGLRVMLTQQAL